jgi:hypothetical protein
MLFNWLLFHKSVIFEILMNVSLSVIPEDGGSSFLLKLCSRLLKCAASHPAVPDLFWRTPNVFLENGITTLVTCHIVPSQTANAVVPSRCFVVLFVCKLLSNLNAVFGLQTWLMILRPSRHPQRCPRGDRLFITHYRDTRQ